MEANQGWVEMSRVDGYVLANDLRTGLGFEGVERLLKQSGGFELFNIKECSDLIEGKVGTGVVYERGIQVVVGISLEDKGPSEPGVSAQETEDSATASAVSGKIKVLLADDHKMMREGLKKIVEEEEDLEVVGEASNGEEAVELARETSPDIIVMDVNMPVMDGITATQEITSAMPGQRVIGLSLHDHERVIESMRSAGAIAYLTKNEAFETLCATIRSEANRDR